MKYPKVKEFIELADRAKKIADNKDMEWITKYELIFSDKLLNKVFTTGVDFEWVDPDTTYKEDVMAFVNAVGAKADELRGLEDNQEGSLEKLLKENERHPISFMGKLLSWNREVWLVWEYDLDARYVELYTGNDFDAAFSIFGRQGEG